jgi:hypothetical protein
MSASMRKGTAFETLIVDYLAWMLKDGRIERRAKNGSNDRGDVTGVYTGVTGERMVIECKNTNRLELGTWLKELEAEKGNDDAPVGIIVHKRRGKGKPGEQYVTLTLADLVRLAWGMNGMEQQ